MAKQQKSAKDLAFERERTKLKSTIMQLKSKNIALKEDNNALHEIIADFKTMIRFYQSEIERITGMSMEEFFEDVERREKLDSVLTLLTTNLK